MEDLDRRGHTRAFALERAWRDNFPTGADLKAARSIWYAHGSGGFPLSHADAPRKIAVIVALDVAGYSARTEADEARTTPETREIA